MAILDELRQIVAETLGIDEGEITPEASFIEDLRADSLDLVGLIIAIEEKFGIEIPDEDTEKLATVQDVLDYLQDKEVI